MAVLPRGTGSRQRANQRCGCADAACPPQAYTALLTAAVKGGESDLAVEVYRQMGAEGMTRDRQVFATMVDVHVRQGTMREALQARLDSPTTPPASEWLVRDMILHCDVHARQAALHLVARCCESSGAPVRWQSTPLPGRPAATAAG